MGAVYHDPASRHASWNAPAIYVNTAGAGRCGWCANRIKRRGLTALERHGAGNYAGAAAPQANIESATGAMMKCFRSWIGGRAIARLAGINYLAGHTGTLLRWPAGPGTGSAPLCNVFARRLCSPVSRLEFRGAGCADGRYPVVAQLWLGKAGQTELLGKILVMVIIRNSACCW